MLIDFLVFLKSDKWILATAASLVLVYFVHKVGIFQVPLHFIYVTKWPIESGVGFIFYREREKNKFCFTISALPVI